MTRTTTTTFWVLIRVVKFSGVPHFVTPEGKTSVEVMDAKRYASQKLAEDALEALQKVVGWSKVRKIVLTTSFSISDPYDPRST